MGRRIPRLIAHGGLSFASEESARPHFGYKVAKQFGLRVRPCRPGLVVVDICNPGI
jgi:predicted flavoprotein YhiN